MQRQELEEKYKNIANRTVLLCGLFFGLFRISVELFNGNFHGAKVCGALSALVIGLFLLLQRFNLKNFPLIISSLMFISYLVASFQIDSFRYFYDYYLLTLLVCAVYFNYSNFLILVVVTQVINLGLNIVIPQYMPQESLPSGNGWVHYVLTLSSSLLVMMMMRFAINKSNEVNNAFVSFGALMRVAPNILILVDGNNKIKYLSRSVYNAWGIKEQEDFVGKNFLELFNEDSIKELFGDIMKKGVFYEDYQKISIGEQTKTFNVFADKMSDDKEGGMFFMFNDVSEITRLKELAERESLTDSLTQIANRRAFDMQVMYEWNHSLREGVNLTFLMIDIDFFKKYNDTYGHSQGDVLLSSIARVFNKSLKRGTDFVARLGGEEFGVLLYATNSYQASITAERIRKAVENEVIFTSKGEETGVTISIGSCTLIPQKNLKFSHIIEEADKALYKAKESGRNRVCAADPL